MLKTAENLLKKLLQEPLTPEIATAIARAKEIIQILTEPERKQADEDMKKQRRKEALEKLEKKYGKTSKQYQKKSVQFLEVNK